MKLKKVNYSAKKLVSFDGKLLFTNVSVDSAIKTVREALGIIDEESLPVFKNGFVKLLSTCNKFGAFQFIDIEYHQHRGLAMGFPLCVVMAFLYMELLER